VLHFESIPVFKEQDYTKKKAQVSRIDTKALKDEIQFHTADRYQINTDYEPVPVMQFTARVVLERPMVNPTRFVATKSALRALEATLIALEQLNLGHQFIDSKEWQRDMLPKGCTGADLKKASHDIGIRLFPEVKGMIKKIGDADGLLIAEYARKNRL